jgi:hypothetical protein
MAKAIVPFGYHDVQGLSALLGSLEVTSLVSDLEETR